MGNQDWSTTMPWVVFKVILRFIFVTVNNVYCIPLYALWHVLLIPLRLTNRRLYEKITGTLFKWMLGNVGCWMWTNGYTLVEVGDDLSRCQDEECLVIVNHQSTADVPTLFYALLHHGHVLENCMWIMEYIFKFTNFGFVSVLRGDFFIMQGRETRHLQAGLLKEHMTKAFWPSYRKWMVLFPEGGFLRKRLETSQQYAKKNGYPVLQHVTLPRVGAMEALLSHASSPVMQSNGIASTTTHPDHQAHSTQIGSISSSTYRPLKYLIDITIGYPDRKALDLQTICLGWRKPCETTLHYRYYPIHTVPKDTEGLTKWLYARYVEKEYLLKVYHKTGKFPKFKEGQDPTEFAQDDVELDNGRKVVSSNLYFVLVNLFYLLSTAFHVYIFKLIASMLF